MDDVSSLFAEHSVALECLAAHITGDREDARDLVADAFVALLESGPSERQHATSWLYLTVRHRAYNRVRDRGRAQRRLPALAIDAEQAPAPTRDARVGALVAGAAAELSERDLLAISLRHLQDAPYEEVAAALETTPAQARVVVHRAGTRLRQQVVQSLARRHRAKPGCAESLARGGRHDGCNRCVSVSDEVTALLERGVALPLVRPGRVMDAARDLWRRGHAAMVRVTTGAGDAMAPAAAALAISVAAVLPGLDAPVPSSPLPSMTSAAAVVGASGGGPASAADAHTPSGGAPSTDGVGTSAVAGQVQAVAAGAAIGTPTRFDDPGSTANPTRPLLNQHRPPKLIGLPLGLPDALDMSGGPSIDITAFELATLAGDDGKASALRVRLTFAAPPPPNIAPSLGWRYSDYCRASLAWYGSQKTMENYCAEPIAGLHVYRDRHVGRAPADVRFDGDTIELTIPFASTDAATRELFRPGAELRNVTASVSCNASADAATCEGDYAPDPGKSFSYRIEE